MTCTLLAAELAAILVTSLVVLRVFLGSCQPLTPLMSCIMFVMLPQQPKPTVH